MDEQTEKLGEELKSRIKKTFGRSLSIREVDAGSCNGCEVEVNALTNAIHDIERFGLHVVASPRHADMLLVTGPVTRNMHHALLQTYNATPSPKMVVAMGSCAISGGIFRDSYAVMNGVDQVVPVDAYIPGCPPRPQAIIQGIMVALDKMETKRKN
jgi:NADH-quinone oxidoreductase B subunit